MGRSKQQSGGTVGHLIQGVGFAVGLATEFQAHKKASKTTAAEQNIQGRPSQKDLINDDSYFEAIEERPPAYRDTGSEAKASPVILPQRRPHDKTRGFLRAHAPNLGTYKDIDETAFLAFLKELHKSSQSSGIFTAINITAFGAASPHP
ncbi:uncharacterized protein PV07_10566 [Cladophialophora immunda]|uniref:Uncharacterized protein n=1 Tax=Cladophialophora immunda TaxID=569365 RepID=A0A0D2CMT6_9EURO|nr:uncharacterized protein PV07_10566 [Cladophialophora immunda]KIW24879.1 hypothetical protein PV07_10566 [Cladophialophora immunda]OQU97787.1 hypothetical protein CLAIMM_03672 [Cladophialophora immunda]